MRTLFKWVMRGVLTLVLCVVALLSPVAYVETMCKGTPTGEVYASLLPPEQHRLENRTFMTYPEWHIVHAYEDYAEVIRTGDPHDYRFFSAIRGYWSSLCALNERSAQHGEIDTATKQMVYVIGVSFTAELGLKAAYEETIGRAFTILRGPNQSPADVMSARQAKSYAAFLQQVPWYKWDFRKDAEELRAGITDGSTRDAERQIALGLEYRAKAAYADIIAEAVASTGADELTLQMVVSIPEDVDPGDYEGVSVIGDTPQGTIIQTPRYRTLTQLLSRIASDGFEFVEIAGNDDILFTAHSSNPFEHGALFSFARQGFDDYRHLVVTTVPELAGDLMRLEAAGLKLEHIHDY